ncbi:MAG: VIT1/CCC1 transporter family protein [Thermoprotei archaeon]
MQQIESEQDLSTAKTLFWGEVADYWLYRRLSASESNSDLSHLFSELAETEKKHAEIWSKISGTTSKSVFEKMPAKVSLRVWFYLLTKWLLGIGFVTKLLERNEDRALEYYRGKLQDPSTSPTRKELLQEVLADEEGHETKLVAETDKHAKDLNYTRSIVFGLNDGLVEILAVVTGLAVVSTSALVVAISAIVVGLAGTFSMAAGAYVSSRSSELVTAATESESNSTKPVKEAYYTGVFYFLGAIIATLPFFLGVTGIAGIVTSVIVVSLILSAASAVIAIISETSVKTRVLEMLFVSLGAAVVTIVIGTVVRYHFGIVISA